MVTRLTKPGEGRENVEFLVSVVANPEEFPPPYKVKEEPTITLKLVEDLGRVADVLAFKVSVFDGNGKLVGKPWEKDIGVVSRGLDPAAPAVKLGYSEGAEKKLEGVLITPPANPDAVSWDIVRARQPNGPWTTVATDHWNDLKRHFRDSFPAGEHGAHTWHYVTLPKNRTQIGKSVKDPDTSHTSSIHLDLGVLKPQLKVEIKTWSELHPRPPEPQTPPQKALTKEEEEQRRKAKEIETFVEMRKLVLSWDAPHLTADLEPSNKVEIQICRSWRPAGPFLFWSSLSASEKFIVADEDALEGLRCYFRARFLVPTWGGAIVSEWADVEAAFPEWRRYDGGRYLESGDQLSGSGLPVGPGLKVKFTCASIGYAPSSDRYKPYFRPHGPEGLDEAAYQRYSQDERKRLTDDFWKGYKEREREERRAELEKKLKERLDTWEKNWFEWNKPRTLLPSAPLAAVIGEFIPERPDSKPTGQPQREEDKPKPLYFAIGAGVEFTAPDHGRVFIAANWPPFKVGGSAPERTEEVFLTAHYLSLATPKPIAPGLGPPQWTRTGPEVNRQNMSNLTLSVNDWTPSPGETLEILSAPSAEGPWSRVIERSQKIPVTFKRYEIRTGQGALFCTRLRFTRLGYLGEVWSQPVEIQRQPETMTVASLGGYATLVGRKGQGVQLRVSGAWDPVRFQGIEPYGPEGIPESVFLEKAREWGAKEKAMKAEEKASNQPNLLNLVMEQPGDPKEAAKGGLENVPYFLVDKARLGFRDFQAGALIAKFQQT